MSAHRTDSELRESHLPPPAASWGEISDFAGTFWAYEYWGDAGRCHQVALGIHRSYAQEGRLPEGLPELRTALFMEQRRTVHTGSPPEGERLTYVRAAGSDNSDTPVSGNSGPPSGRSKAVAKADKKRRRR